MAEETPSNAEREEGCISEGVVSGGTSGGTSGGGGVELTPELLVWAYSNGMFPMATERDGDEIQWFSPDPRAVIPLEGFNCPRSVRKKIQDDVFEIRYDTAFEQVMRECANQRKTEKETWINDAIIDGYVQLHRLGLAHCVEGWLDGKLVGGLYGVGLGGAFFGESMFHRPQLGGSNCSKVCMVKLVERLREKGFCLLDVQFFNPHLEQFGVIEISRDEYVRQLSVALKLAVGW